jgi:LysR family glycine cleavage system transcriptional activator
MQAGQSSHVYTIAAPREFVSAWLAPRLAAFRADNPQARFVIVDGEATDFTEANLDLAVRWTDGPGDLEGAPLGPAERVTVGEGDWIGWPGESSEDGADSDAASAALWSAMPGRRSPRRSPAWAARACPRCWSPAWIGGRLDRYRRQD